MSNFTPRTQEELDRRLKEQAFRAKQLLGFLFLVGLVLFVAAKFWVITVPVAALVITVWAIRRSGRLQRWEVRRDDRRELH
ncbi:hypothetical protein [Actinocorallia aurantiaca]|uniref:Uncharacterized protein n=1 Tax=Actinocorallia aurantiaca TaxID=46204 RepID=A0ABN3UNH5_9ACTN